MKQVHETEAEVKPPDQSELSRPIPQNSVESALGCTSGSTLIKRDADVI